MEDSKNVVAQPTLETLKDENLKLKNYLDQLLQQRNQLAQQLNGVQNVLTKLPYLFKVIENAKVFNKDFVAMCIQEVQEILTPPSDETPDKENTETAE